MATIDTLQDAVNTLTSSTTTLLNEVSVNKSTLTESKDLAETAATSATTQAANAASSASAASSSASSASSSASAASASAASASAIVTGVATGMPSVRPSLNLDFVNSKTVDPRISFTRSTTATYYDGKTTAKAEENLMTYSQTISSAVWGGYANGVTITEDSAVAPDGTTTAGTITGDGVTNSGQVGRASSSLNVVGVTYTVSAYVKANGHNFIGLRTNRSANGQIVFDLATPAVGTATGTWVNGTISDVGNGWYRISASFVQQSTSGYIIYPFMAESATATDGIITPTTNGFYLWGIQTEDRDSLTAYTPTTGSPITNYIPVLQTAAINEPRLDHDPVTGEAKGLLIEESRTNLLPYSEEFNNAVWTKANSHINWDIAVAPDGTLTADKFYEGTASASHDLRQTKALSTSTAYTYSFYAKAGERSKIAYYLALTGSSVTGEFDLETGTATNGSMQDVGNGWYRCWATNSTTEFGGTYNMILILKNGSSTIYTGDGYSGIYIWGAQLEAGSFPTSYIPTSGASVTRAAEDASLTTSFNPKEGTLSVKAMTETLKSSYPCYAAIKNSIGSTNNYLGILKQGSGYAGIYTESKVNGAVVAGATIGLAVEGVPFTETISYDQRSYFSAGNNGTEADTGLNMLPATVLMIGTRKAGSLYANGYIQNITYYPQALATSEMTALVQS